MEVYKFIKLNDGNILLQKITIDKTGYDIVNQQNGDILLKKINNVEINSIKDIKKYNFTKSVIFECTLDTIKHNKLKYKSILDKIYNIINNGTQIIKNTKLNIKTIKKEDEGFYYLEHIGISIQMVDSNKCLLEIVNQCQANKIKLLLKTKLTDGKMICIDI